MLVNFSKRRGIEMDANMGRLLSRRKEEAEEGIKAILDELFQGTGVLISNVRIKIFTQQRGPTEENIYQIFAPTISMKVD